jgi:hypothetical protein
MQQSIRHIKGLHWKLLQQSCSMCVHLQTLHRHVEFEVQEHFQSRHHYSTVEMKQPVRQSIE